MRKSQQDYEWIIVSINHISHRTLPLPIYCRNIGLLLSLFLFWSCVFIVHFFYCHFLFLFSFFKNIFSFFYFYFFTFFHIFSHFSLLSLFYVEGFCVFSLTPGDTHPISQDYIRIYLILHGKIEILWYIFIILYSNDVIPDRCLIHYLYFNTLLIFYLSRMG